MGIEEAACVEFLWKVSLLYLFFVLWNAFPRLVYDFNLLVVFCIRLSAWLGSVDLPSVHALGTF
jgi:hypothetical protein